MSRDLSLVINFSSSNRSFAALRGVRFGLGFVESIGGLALATLLSVAVSAEVDWRQDLKHICQQQLKRK